MTYGYNSNKKGRKQSRSKTKQLEVRKILASLTMAAGIMFTTSIRKEKTVPAILPITASSSLLWMQGRLPISSSIPLPPLPTW